MFFQSHLNSAVSILQSYNGEEPFHLFIKKFFAANKKFGSKDRKQIASLCYNYFRLGQSAKNISIEGRIKLAEQVINRQSSMENGEWRMEEIFPFNDELSDGIDAKKFAGSFLIQPKLFLRIRPGNKNKITGKLAGAGISYQLINNDSIAFANSTKVENVIEPGKEAVIQDLNSQRIGDFLNPSTINYQPSTSVWDCCAASGGKSIMAYDIIPNIQLTVSDKRESILQNLKKRFEKAGIKNYNSFVADLENSKFKIQNSKFDLIIADVPCTGSGTWSRTPEQLYFFKEKKIIVYASLQKRILENVIPHLKDNGHLLYITCSVFKKENEEAVNFIKEKFGFELLKMELLKGYEMRADTMFAALFKKT